MDFTQVISRDEIESIKMTLLNTTLKLNGITSNNQEIEELKQELQSVKDENLVLRNEIESIKMTLRNLPKKLDEITNNNQEIEELKQNLLPAKDENHILRSKIEPIKLDLLNVSNSLENMNNQQEIQKLKQELQLVKDDICVLRGEIQPIELTSLNVTNRNIHEVNNTQEIQEQPAKQNKNSVRDGYILETKKQRPNVVFLGDSFLYFLQHRPTWKMFEQLNSLNLAELCVTTHHVLQKVQSGILTDLQPKVVVLHVGEHNCEQPKVVVQEIEKIVKTISDQLPDCEIKLLAPVGTEYSSWCSHTDLGLSNSSLQYLNLGCLCSDDLLRDYYCNPSDKGYHYLLKSLYRDLIRIITHVKQSEFKTIQQ